MSWCIILTKASRTAWSISSRRPPRDPETVAVKMTAYRIGDDTPFVKSLVKAAEGGKQVACVIEIKARFDEERNLHWAEPSWSAPALTLRLACRV